MNDNQIISNVEMIDFEKCSGFNHLHSKLMNILDQLINNNHLFSNNIIFYHFFIVVWFDLKEGEGIMLRKSKSKYEIGRTYSMLKLKVKLKLKLKYFCILYLFFWLIFQNNFKKGSYHLQAVVKSISKKLQTNTNNIYYEIQCIK